MREMCERPCSAKRAIATVLSLGTLATLTPRTAQAFQLVSPAPWIVEGPNGDPQTFGPCGVNASVCYTPTGAVTTYTAGQEITLNWVETVPSDGWFRIALSTATNAADLVDPPVSLNDAGLASDANIAPALDPDAAPLGITTSALPVLADGLFAHVAADLPGVPYRYSWNLFLPNVTCDRCTLQVIQFLSNRPDSLPNGDPAGYYAHHCANITILPADDAATTAPDLGGALSIDPDAGGPSAACSGVEAGGPSEAGETDEAGHASDAGEAGPSGGSDADAGLREAGEGADSSTEAGEAGEAGAGVSSGASNAGSGGCGCIVAGAEESPVLACLAGFTALAALTLRRRRRGRGAGQNVT